MIMSAIPKPWSKEFSCGLKLCQRFGSVWTSEPKMQMLSLEHFSHISWQSSSAYFWLVWQELGKGLLGAHRGTLRSMPAWWQISCQVGIPSTGNRAPSDLFLSDGALGLSHRSQSPRTAETEDVPGWLRSADLKPFRGKSTNPAGCCFSLTGIYSLLFSCLENTRRAAAFAPGGKHLCKCPQNIWWMSRFKESWAMRKKATGAGELQKGNCKWTMQPSKKFGEMNYLNHKKLLQSDMVWGEGHNPA